MMYVYYSLNISHDEIIILIFNKKDYMLTLSQIDTPPRPPISKFSFFSCWEGMLLCLWRLAEVLASFQLVLKEHIWGVLLKSRNPAFVEVKVPIRISG